MPTNITNRKSNKETQGSKQITQQSFGLSQAIFKFAISVMLFLMRKPNITLDWSLFSLKIKQKAFSTDGHIGGSSESAHCSLLMMD